MMKHILAAALWGFVMAVAFPVYAQQPKENNLGSLWSQVADYYSGIKSKTAEVEAANYQQRAVKSNQLPQLKAQAQNTYGTYEGSLGAFFPQAGFFNVSGAAVPIESSTSAANTFASATVNWELYSFGKLRKQNQAAGALYQQALSEKEAYLLRLKKLLSERYINLLYNQAKWNWTQKQVERLNDIRKTTAGLSASGLRPAADSLLASSSHIQALGEQHKWEGFKNASLIKLLELYGGDTVDYMESSERFIQLSQGAVNQFSSVDSAHPILHALEEKSQYYTLSGEAQKRASLPTVSLLGGYSYRGTGIQTNEPVSGSWKDGFNNTATNYLVGIGITWDISALQRDHLKGEKLFKEAESVQQLQLQYKQAMQADLAASQSKIAQQYQQLIQTDQAVKQSQAAYQMYLARYKSGLIALSELLQIQNLLEQAANLHMEASRDYWMQLAYEAELTTDFDYLFNHL
ncbi:TolC family protein [Flavobacterium sp. NKUCC04_CG]|uniref:TolC family protein n=1 Tax=Flavobacterium sp. NKUCC04_CG TaxID=2842121 RepID=UPI001C5B732C|nr:TolC family protein [Flavobacterium sp. NKUCC04_CG]MBW3518077.1 TolC family protein [Flavobacterium sp. NKUCC04_CG]